MLQGTVTFLACKVQTLFFLASNQTVSKYKTISSMASKTINIRFIKLFLTKKSCIASYYRKLSTNIKTKNHKIKTSFDIRGKLSL